MVSSIYELDELEKVLSEFEPSTYVFRGQIAHYLDNLQQTSIVSSFSRLGCHPPSMQKWWFYAAETLLSLFGPEYTRKITHDQAHALLQHYGWRSFFIDVTTDPRIAAWFASNKYVENTNLLITEDCYETGVLCEFKIAKYIPAYDYGYIYVISKPLLGEAQIECHDLCDLGFSDFTPRYISQSGLLLNCERVPQKAIIKVLKVPTNVLADYSSKHNAQSLFPSRKNDKLYNILLSTPFELLTNHNRSPLGTYGPYRRALNIPEYDFSFTKIHPASTAFYDNSFVISPSTMNVDYIIRCSDFFLYHSDIDAKNDIGELTMHLKTDQSLLVECQGLLRLPPFYDSPIYVKGVKLTKVNENLFRVNGICVKYIGKVFIDYIIEDGWHYELKNTEYCRVINELDCPCNYERKHNLLFTILKKINIGLSENAYRIEDNLTYMSD